jgi:acetamidase/formamidase
VDILVINHHHARQNVRYVLVRSRCGPATRSPGLAPAKALSLCSLAIDFRVAEAVDGTQVVVGSVPKSLLPKR